MIEQEDLNKAREKNVCPKPTGTAMTGDSIVAVARRLSFIRETAGPNRGMWVEFILALVGCKPGDSWCAAFVSLILRIVYRGKSPIGFSAGCDELYNAAAKKGLAFADWRDVRPGDLIFWKNGQGGPDDLHHVAIATTRAALALGKCYAIAGNTSDTEDTDNGEGVFEKVVTINSGKKFVRPPEA